MQPNPYWYDESSTIPVSPYDTHEAHVIEQLRYKLEQADRAAAHFKVIAQELERSLQYVKETNKRNFDRAARADAAIEELVRGTGGTVPSFTIQGPFTICGLVDPVAERIFHGAAFCALEDKFDASIGEAISYGRAAGARADYYAQKAFAK